MSYLADAHREWHYVHGALAACPLDCGAGEAAAQDAADAAEWDALTPAEQAKATAELAAYRATEAAEVARLSWATPTTAAHDLF